MIIEIHLTFVSLYIISSIRKYRPQREIVWPKTEIVSSYSSLYITSQFTLVLLPTYRYLSCGNSDVLPSWGKMLAPFNCFEGKTKQSLHSSQAGNVQA